MTSRRECVAASLSQRRWKTAICIMDGWALTSQSAKDERRKIHTSTLVIPDLRFES